MSRSPSHGAALTSGHGFVNTFSKVLAASTFCWLLMRCPPCYTFPSSFSSLASLFSCGTSVIPSLMPWLCGSCFALRFTHTSHSYLFSSQSTHTIRRLLSLAWHVYANKLYPVFEFLSPIKRGIRNMHVRRPAARLYKRLMAKAEELVLAPDESPKLDAGILESLLATLDEDVAREKFFEAVTGLYRSNLVDADNVKKWLPPIFFTNFRRTVNQFLDQTLSFDSVSELVRSRRLLTCLNATRRVLGDLKGMSITNQIIWSGSWIEMPPYILRRWRKWHRLIVRPHWKLHNRQELSPAWRSATMIPGWRSLGLN